MYSTKTFFLRIVNKCNLENKQDGTHHSYLLLPWLFPSLFTHIDICYLFILIQERLQILHSYVEESLNHI